MSKKQCQLPGAAQYALAESYRFLRTNLFFLEGQTARTIMVTSALPREGRSAIAANLAIVCANGRKRVLLVDSDFRRPTQHVRFGVSNDVGLAQALQHGGQKLVVQQARPGMDILTSGPLPSNPPDHLESDTMARLVEFTKTKYDFVVFDSPPVLPVTDAVILAGRVEGVLLVVRASHTRREQAGEAVKQLTRAKANLLGVVLNMVNSRGAGGRTTPAAAAGRPRRSPRWPWNWSKRDEADSTNTLPQ